MSQKVAIIGFGSEGLSAYNFWKARGAAITVFDESSQPAQVVPDDVTFISGAGCFDDLHGFDVVMRFPAVVPSRIHTDGQVSSVTQEFFKYCPAPIIGVTGTKGKGTTTSLIHLMLQKAGLRAHIAGNIGIPALDILPAVQPDDVVVLELSSFQLWDLHQSPRVAVVLMVEQEHLDYHADMADYLGAKANIVKWQTADDVVVHHPTNDLTAQIIAQGPGHKIPYGFAPGAHVVNDTFIIDAQEICPVADMRLVGGHNIDNICAAITAAWQFTQDAAAIAAAIHEFGGLEHRLKFVRQVNGVRYYDDSFATTPTSAVASMQAFAQPKVLILGGSDKGSDYAEVGQVAAASNMRAVILIGLMRHKLAAALDAAGYKGEKIFFDETSTMTDIVMRAAATAQPGDVVILSPACASFDMFKNYKDRGDQFIAAVQNLG